MTLHPEPFAATTPPERDATRMVMHAHRSSDVWTWASAVAIAAELRRDLVVRPRTRLLVSADADLAGTYKALSKAPLDWDRVDVALVDEYWLLPDDPDSHARFIRANLLQHHAAAARFEPITLAGRRLEEAVAIANAHAQQPTSVLVLGMGADGHTASLFAGALDLGRALASRQPYVAIDSAAGSAGAPSRKRISLTPAGFARARSRVLVIRGDEKRAALDRALACGSQTLWPILAAIDVDNGVPLHVHWCA